MQLTITTTEIRDAQKCVQAQRANLTEEQYRILTRGLDWLVNQHLRRYNER